MNKDKAKLALENYKKLTHRYFVDGESVVRMGDFVIFEDETTQSLEEFWKLREGSQWDDGWEIVDERRWKTFDDMKSRIQILDENSRKWGQRTNPEIENFDDFCCTFDSKAVERLVYIAMDEYKMQERAREQIKNKELFTDEKLEEMFLEGMKSKWSHCFIDGKLIQRPSGLEDELQAKIAGAKMVLEKLNIRSIYE